MIGSSGMDRRRGDGRLRDSSSRVAAARSTKKIKRAIGIVERAFIVTFALSGATGVCNAAQCALALTFIIAGAELARCVLEYSTER